MPRAFNAVEQMRTPVTGIGARGPLGLSALQLTLGLRAKKKEPRSIEQLDRFGQRIGVCFVGGIPETVTGLSRMSLLAAPALTEAIADSEERAGSKPMAGAEPEPIAVVLSVSSEGRPDDEEEWGTKLLSLIGERSGIPIDFARSIVVRKDQAGFAEALWHAQTLLDAGAPRVAVGGVDSYFHPDVLKWLDDNFRLASLKATKGFIPGEGAAFLILGRGATAHAPVAELARIDSEEEASDLDEEQPNIGAGLTTLLKRGAESAGMPTWLINDCNGERHRRTEFDFAATRILESQDEVENWASHLGDCGAAAGAMFSVVAIKLWELGCRTNSQVSLTLANELGDRCMVTWARPGSHPGDGGNT